MVPNDETDDPALPEKHDVQVAFYQSFTFFVYGIVTPSVSYKSLLWGGRGRELTYIITHCSINILVRRNLKICVAFLICVCLKSCTSSKLHI
jgi:hypothetical protein